MKPKRCSRKYPYLPPGGWQMKCGHLGSPQVWIFATPFDNMAETNDYLAENLKT